MKNNFFTIIKYTMINNLNLNRKIKGKSNPILLLGGIVLAILALVYFYVEMYYTMMKQQGIQNFLLPAFVAVATISIFSTVISKAESILFKPKDFDMLATMPIKHATILSTKFAALIVINLFTALILMLPLIVKFTVAGDYTIFHAVLAFLMSLCIPCIPAIVGCIISVIITYFSSKFRFTKVITTILLIVFTGVAIITPMLLVNNTTMPNGEISISSIETIMKNIYYPVYLFYDAINGNIISTIIYFVLNISLSILFITLIAKKYNNIIQKLGESYKGNNYVYKESKKSSKIKSMYIKEIKRLTSTTIYLINTCIGVFLMVLSAASLLFINDDLLAQLFVEIPDYKMYLSAILISVTSVCIAMSNTTCCSISLEGKNLWIYKSTPTSEKEIFYSKILVNLTVTLLPMLITFICVIIRFKLDFISMLFLIVIPTLVAILISIWGLIINLKYPLLNYKSEIQVVKQSMSSMIGIMSGMLVSMAHIFAFQMIQLPINVILSCVTVELIVLILILWKILNKWGVNKFKKINC